MDDQHKSTRDAAVHVGTVALWGEQVGDARQNATRVVDALIVAGWRPPAADRQADVVKAAARALWDATYVYQSRVFDKVLADGDPMPFVVQARAAVLAVFESPRWRQLAKEAHDDRERLRAVHDLHKPVPMYGECEHTSEQHQDLGIEIVEAPEIGETCEAARGMDICLACCTDRHSDFGQTQQCADYHEPPCWPCPTAMAAGHESGIPVLEGRPQ